MPIVDRFVFIKCCSCIFQLVGSSVSSLVLYLWDSCEARIGHIAFQSCLTLVFQCINNLGHIFMLISWIEELAHDVASINSNQISVYGLDPGVCIYRRGYFYHSRLGLKKTTFFEVLSEVGLFFP